MVQQRRKRSILGVGLDGDGEVRVTRGRDFHLVGGSEQTHESMQEKCIKLNEKLDQRGKTLHDVDRAELRDMAAECGMSMDEPGS